MTGSEPFGRESVFFLLNKVYSSIKHINSNIGVKVSAVLPNSPAFRAGIRVGDIITAIDDELIHDELEFSFFTAVERSTLSIIRNDNELYIELIRNQGEMHGVEISQKPVSTCHNNCIFCFVKQLPDGMRKSLYVKDEDYRYSFLNGNYITLTSLDMDDLERIGVMGLSPLYISVHATDPVIRRKMLKNKFAGNIMDQLFFLSEMGISYHTQIVVCPGYNDGDVLERSILDLLELGDSVLSIAVVPVGLTKFSRSKLTPMDSNCAKDTCEIVDRIGDKDSVELGERRIFCADELYIRANIKIPSAKYYNDYPQIENGVGLIRQLQEEWKKLKRKILKSSNNNFSKKSKKQNEILVLTSVSAFAYVQNITNQINRYFPNVNLTVTPVLNNFFGESVTVAGLITAKDIIRTLKEYGNKVYKVVIPSIIFNYNNYTLDGFSLERIVKYSGMNVVKADNITELLSVIE